MRGDLKELVEWVQDWANVISEACGDVLELLEGKTERHIFELPEGASFEPTPLAPRVCPKCGAKLAKGHGPHGGAAYTCTAEGCDYRESPLEVTAGAELEVRQVGQVPKLSPLASHVYGAPPATSGPATRTAPGSISAPVGLVQCPEKGCGTVLLDGRCPRCGWAGPGSVVAAVPSPPTNVGAPPDPNAPIVQCQAKGCGVVLLETGICPRCGWDLRQLELGAEG